MMKRIIPILTCLSIALTTTVNATLVSQSSAANDSIASFNKRVTVRESAIAKATRDAEITGWNIYRYEALADLAGYAVAASTTADQRAGIIGSIVLPGASQWIVRFYAKNDRGFYTPVADVSFDINNRPSVKKDGLASFNLQELGIIKATELVKTQETPCDGTYKTVAIAGNDRNVAVYYIRECLDPTHIPEGQHMRYIISQDGSRILSKEESSRRCNMVSTSIDKATSAKEFKLTSSKDPQPTEMQIYLSLRYHVNIFLATTRSNLYWQIDRGVTKSD